MKLLIAAFLVAITPVIADQNQDALDICDAKYRLAVTLISNDYRYFKIDKETYQLLMRKAGIALASCQYQAATANER